MPEGDLGDRPTDPGFRVPVGPLKKLPLLDQVIGQQFPGDIFHLPFFQARGLELILPGGINGFPFREADSQQGFDGFQGRAAGIVPHPGQKTDPDQPVKILGQRFKGGNLGYRIGKNSNPDVFQLLIRQRGVKGQHLEGADLLQGQAQIISGLFPQVFPLGVL